MLRRIVVASDGSERAGRAVSFAAELARRFDSDLTVLNVRMPGDPDAEPLVLHKQAQAAGATLRVVESDVPADAICDAAKELRADAIVIGNLGMTKRKEFLLANVPNRISHRAACTVIIVDTRTDKERGRS